jgi:anaerobic selenocysteine-containing dehydrogenase
VEKITGIAAAKLRQAARMISQSKRLLCTVLQGVYQSNQGSAAACQVNNLVLIRGTIGKPDCGVIQSNGQPTAQNTRETGCDGEWAGFRNWQNPRHVQDLARVWNVEPEQLPSWAPKTHALQIFRLAETGLIRFLWIVGTNPAVSLPELHRIRSGGFGLLRDLHALFVLAAVHMNNVVLRNAAKELRDNELLNVCNFIAQQIHRQQAWALTQVKEHAADSVVVPS